MKLQKWLFIAFIVVYCIIVLFGVMSKVNAEPVKCEVEKILIEKSKKQLHLIDCNGNITKTYNVRVGRNKGPKTCDGDKRSPEGTYHIIEKRDSKYYRFLALDYPNANDKKNARKAKCYAGDSIGIHSWKPGLPKEGSLGCITVWTKDEILEIDSLVKVGTEVEIKE